MHVLNKWIGKHPRPDHVLQTYVVGIRNDYKYNNINKMMRVKMLKVRGCPIRSSLRRKYISVIFYS